MTIWRRALAVGASCDKTYVNHGCKAASASGPRRQIWVALLLTIAAALRLLFAGPALAGLADCFQITVVDDQTGRGVPLVQLRTVNEIRYFTDSNGIIAIDDPDLMGQNIYFRISSPGYVYTKDGFGYNGTALKVTPGGTAVIKIKRDNIAERLYRLTGGGIYRDSVMTGHSVPIEHPLLDGQVFGQDTVEVVPYNGKIYWFFGDTNRPSYPLGQFGTSGATSPLPSNGGMDPSVGVNLDYRVGDDGFSRPMIPMKESAGPVWVGGLFTMQDSGREHLFTHFTEVKSGMVVAKAGLAEFDDSAAQFKPVCYYPIDNRLQPDGHPFKVSDNGRNYIYFDGQDTANFPLIRCHPDLKDATDLSTYEGYTCLSPGSSFAGGDTKIDRAPDDALIWGWKKATPPLSYKQETELISLGKIRQDEAEYELRDIDSNKLVQADGGSVFWNPYRKRWIMITTQAYGSPSYLGEVWFSEADTPTGPWVYARKIVTHDHYTFYNPTQHPFFDQDNGRVVYFEGTYVDTFSDVKDLTPRYNYNQLMYRLSLDDPRLALPAPVYQIQTNAGPTVLAMREQLAENKTWPIVKSIPFYAIPPSRAQTNLIPIYTAANGELTVQADAKPPLFFALPTSVDNAAPTTAPLYVYKDASGQQSYTTDEKTASQNGAPPTPICRVWKNPSTVLTFDYNATPMQ